MPSVFASLFGGGGLLGGRPYSKGATPPSNPEVGHEYETEGHATYADGLSFFWVRTISDSTLAWRDITGTIATDIDDVEEVVTALLLFIGDTNLAIGTTDLAIGE